MNLPNMALAAARRTAAPLARALAKGASRDEETVFQIQAAIARGRSRPIDPIRSEIP